MVAYFPTPYPDELLYSVLARNCRHTGLPPDALVNVEILGKRHAIPSFDLPFGLKSLAALIPSAKEFSSKYLLIHRTTFNYLVAFATPVMAKQATKSVLKGKVTDWYLKLGMAALVPDRRFSLSYCRLKPGRAFSTNGRSPRLAAIGIIEADSSPPICIVDVDHSGGYALSLLAVTFKQQLPLIEIETAIQKIIDGLVDNNGHWSNEVENELEHLTHIDRFPKLISPRDEGAESGRTIHRAIKLASKLQLFETNW